MTSRPCFHFQSTQSSSNEHPIFYSLWNFKGSLADTVENGHQLCSSREEIFDPFTRKCRQLSCSPGYVYNTTLSKCQKLPSLPNAVYGMCCAQQQTLIGYVTEDKLNEIPSARDDCVENYITMIAASNNSQWKHHRMSKSSVIEDMLHADSICNIGDKLNNAILKSDYFLNNCNRYSLDYLHICGKNVIPDNCNGRWFKDNAAEFHLVNHTHLAELFKYKDTFILPTLVINYISYDFSLQSKSFSKNEIILVCGNLVEPLNCLSMVTLTVDEYEISGQNKSWISVLSSNLSLVREQFIMLTDGRVQICSSHLENGVPQIFNYFGNLGRINIIGSCVSLVAFVFVFGVHCSLKENRKRFHGRSMIFLSGALFGAYLLPILTQKIRIVGHLCYFFALVTHFMWLSVFSWFTVISLSMTYTFVMRPLERREVRETSVLYRYILPVGGWGVPVAIVLLCSVADMCDIKGFSYGVENPCWISGEIANLIAFGFPVGLSLLCSSSCFIATAITIWRSDRQRRILEGRDKIITWKDVVITLKVSVSLR